MLIASITAAVMIVSTWVVLCALFAGVGLGVKQILLARVDRAPDLFDAFWMGFAGVICLLQIWHLFLPVSSLTLGFVACLSAAGFWRQRGSLRPLVPGGAALIVMLLAALWVANRGSGLPEGDSAVYHIQAVRWANTYAVVPGLGNLHDRLAFNTSRTLYDALLNTGIWNGRASHIATGLPVLMLLLQVLMAAGRLLRRKDTAASMFDMLLLTPIIAVSIGGTVSSLSTDVPPAIVLFVAASRLYKLLSAPADRDRLESDTLSIVVLTTLAVCLKINSLVLAPAIAGIALLHTLLPLPRFDRWSLVRRSAAVVVMGLVPWMLRGLVLSGYPLYPGSWAGISADWRVPAELARAESAWVTAFARHSQVPGFGWVRNWIVLERLFTPVFVSYMALPLVVAAGMVLLGWCLRRLHLKPTPAVRHEAWALLVIAGVGLGGWFVLAPAPRFGFFLFWIIAATCSAQVLPYLPLRGPALVVPMCSLALAPFLVRIPWAEPVANWVPVISRAVVLPPGPDHGLSPMPVSDVYEFMTASGLSIFVPVNGNRCYDAPLPCTPHPATNLAIRKTWDGRPVFLTVGPWQQMYWPDASSRFAESFRRRLHP